MMNKFLVTAVAAAAVALVGCSSAGGDSNGINNPPPTGTERVAGPLDPVQSALSDQVLAQLQTALAGTPLEGVVACADTAINQSTLDIVDAVLLGLQNPTSLQSTTPEQVQAQVLQLANNLGSLLSSLATGTCSSSGVPSTNPLADTPLAPLGDALLPVLQQIQDQLGGAGGGGGGGGGAGGNGFVSLAALVGQLNTALQGGLSQLPPEATSAPVLGGIFGTLTTALSDVSTLLSAVGANNSGAASTAAQDTLNHLLSNVLTQVVPAEFIETQAGQPGVITDPINDAIDTLTSNVGTALGQGLVPLIDALNGDDLAPVIDPVVNTLLPQIVDPLAAALADAGTGGGGGGGGSGPTGTPLDAVLAPLADALTGLLGGGGGAPGLPGGGGSTCAFAGVPVLEVLCTIL